MHGKCRGCGRVILMSPASQYKCPTCGGLFRPLSTNEEREIQRNTEGITRETTRTTICHNCGAELDWSPGTTGQCTTCRTTVYVPYPANESEQQRQESERQRQETARRAEQERKKRQQLVEEAHGLLHECICSNLSIIDSNIWMNKEYACFFVALRIVLTTENARITLPRLQFDEICSIKRKTDYGDERNSNARYAIQCIEQFQEAGLLDIQMNVSSQRDGHADPEIIRLLLRASEPGKTVYLATDDVELRIRAREAARKVPKTQLRIIGLSARLPAFLVFCQEHEDFCRRRGLRVFERDAGLTE